MSTPSASHGSKCLRQASFKMNGPTVSLPRVVARRCTLDSAPQLKATTAVDSDVARLTTAWGGPVLNISAALPLACDPCRAQVKKPIVQQGLPTPMVVFATTLDSPKGMPLFHNNTQVGWVLRLVKWLINPHGPVMILIALRVHAQTTRGKHGRGAHMQAPKVRARLLHRLDP